MKELVSSLKNKKVQEVFGVGTAATIISFESISYNGKKYVLPKSKEESISTFLYKKLDGVKKGEIKDTHNWAFKIKL